MNYRFYSFLITAFMFCNILASTHHEPVNAGAIGRIIEQEIDHLFEPYKHQANIKAYINQVKQTAIEDLVNSIIYYYSNHLDAKKEALRATRRWAVDFVVSWAEYLVWEKLKNPPVNPELLDAYAIVETIKDIIRSQAHLHLKEYDRLTLVIKNLYHNIDVLVDQEIKDAVGLYYF